jgi:NTP pyrophosphatase (non-canonical NTP hydrolase)
MSLKSYQQQIDKSLQRLEKPYWHPLSQLARMIEEVGEVSRILNDKFGDKPKKRTEEHEKLEDELADVLYTVFCLANSQNIDLDEPFKRAINKINTRDKDRFQKK